MGAAFALQRPAGRCAGGGYKIFTRSNAAGVDAFAKQDGSFFLFFQGHTEYEADTLLREYRRDVARFLAGEREHYPQMPLGYFNDHAAAAGQAFQTRALCDRRGELIAEFPKSGPEGGAADRRPAIAGGAAAPDLARLAAPCAPAGRQFGAVSAAETLGIYGLFGSVAI